MAKDAWGVIGSACVHGLEQTNKDSIMIHVSFYVVLAFSS